MGVGIYHMKIIEHIDRRIAEQQEYIKIAQDHLDRLLKSKLLIESNPIVVEIFDLLDGLSAEDIAQRQQR